MTVLDTHAWLWWASASTKLSARARRQIDEAATLGVSAISCWEIAMLVHKGRLEFDRDVLTWLDQALALPRVELLPLTPRIAVASVALGDEFQGDPADRIIVATARELDAKLVTRDRLIRESKKVECVW